MQRAVQIPAAADTVRFHILFFNTILLSAGMLSGLHSAALGYKKSEYPLTVHLLILIFFVVEKIG